MRVIELFAGIGSQHSALKRLGIDFEVIGIAEIDKDATLSYLAIHHNLEGRLKRYDYPSAEEMRDYLQTRNVGYDFKKNKPYNWESLIDRITQKPKKDLQKYYLASKLANNYGDISKIERLDPADFWTYSFPCQDLSVAGKQKGLAEGTRSGLLYEVERLLDVAKENNELPKYLMLENVKNLVGKKFKGDFDRWIGKLNQLGYNTYWKVLNAKHYGVPQNRERVFAISIRKDVDMGYQFPEPFESGIRLKDILEEEVDEKFYISNEKVGKLLNSNFRQERDRLQTKDHCDTLLARDCKDPKAVKIPQATTKGYIECSVPGVFDITYPDSKTRRGRVQDHGEIVPTLTAASQDIMYINNISDGQSFAKKKSKEMFDELGYIPEMWNPYNKAEIKDVAPTLTTMCDRSGSSSTVLIKQHQFRIRKLTPKECFRLMGFTDEEFHKAEKVNSNSQLYKQAGNSIVVDVLYYLFRNLFLEADGEEYYQQLQMEVNYG